MLSKLLGLNKSERPVQSSTPTTSALATALSKYPVESWKVVAGAAVWDERRDRWERDARGNRYLIGPCYKVPNDATLELVGSGGKVIRLVTRYDFDGGWMSGDDFLEIDGVKSSDATRQEVAAYLKWLLVQPPVWKQLVRRCDEHRVSQGKSRHQNQAVEDSLEDERKRRLKEDLF